MSDVISEMRPISRRQPDAFTLVELPEVSMRRRAAFTLVELLVVIGIIALLVALLLPALNRARHLSMQARCASNLHQIGVAFTAYMMQSSGVFPSASDCERSYTKWGGKNGTFVLTDEPDRLINPYIGAGGATSNIDTGYEVFFCPFDTGAGAGDWPQDRFPTEYDWWGTSYFYNSSANANDPNLGLHNKRFSAVRSPTRVVTVSCWPFNVHFTDFWEFSKMYWHDSRQKGWANVLFVDGHVGYHQATRDNPDFQNGPEWSFRWDAGLR